MGNSFSNRNPRIQEECLHIMQSPIRTRNIPRLLELLSTQSEHIDITVLCWDGFTIFHHAVAIKNKEALSRLLRIGIQQGLRNGLTQEESLEFVRKWLNHLWIMLVAVHHGNRPIIRMLHRWDPTLIRQIDRNSWNVLHYAAISGDASLIEFLVDLGKLHLPIDGKSLMDHQSNNGETPLHFAPSVSRMSLSPIEMLIRLGSKAIDTPNRDGATPLHRAIQTNNWEKISMLRALCANTKISTMDWNEARCKYLTDPLDEEEVHRIRCNVYFNDSLVWRLLREII